MICFNKAGKTLMLKPNNSFRSYPLFKFAGPVFSLLNAAVEDSLSKNVLGCFASHVSVARLLGHENSAELSLGSVNAVHLQLHISTQDIESLVVLVEELRIAFNTVLEAGKGSSEVISSGGTTTLGVKEKASAVRRDSEGATKIEACLDRTSTAGCSYQVLNGEKEWHTLPTW